MAKQKMAPREALVQILMADSMKTGFGIVGPAYRDTSNLFLAAVIRFIPVAHQNS
ncbi:MAG: hypothetical protein KQI81_12880 [Deltaproteobacteria bacterium]|nr:hypothetical protein [Deltaproteobacteria bacterium]